MPLKIPQEYLPIISDYAKVLLPAFITYLVTRYTLSRPRRYEIREKQLNLVYLPLYLLTKQYISNKPFKENSDIFFRKAEKIFYKNYQYVYPKTLKLFDKLRSEWTNGNHNTYHIMNFESQVTSDYEKLKRELGYPSKSFVEIFNRMSTLNKILYLTLLVFIAGMIFCFASGIVLLLSGDILNGLSACFCGCILIAAIYFISYPMRH